jgi:hypothetical protein
MAGAEGQPRSVDNHENHPIQERTLILSTLNSRPQPLVLALSVVLGTYLPERQLGKQGGPPKEQADTNWRSSMVLTAGSGRR